MLGFIDIERGTMDSRPISKGTCVPFCPKTDRYCWPDALEYVYGALTQDEWMPGHGGRPEEVC